MKYFIGWVIITISYFITLYSSVSIGSLLFPEQEYVGDNSYQIIEENILYLKYFVTVMMIVVPYIIAGIYTKISHQSIKGTIWISVVPVVLERVIIFTLGLFYVPKFLSDWDLSSVVPFIQWKTPALYFSYVYILSGIISIFIAIIFANLNSRKVN
jgi:hypothetical protein